MLNIFWRGPVTFSTPFSKRLECPSEQFREQKVEQRSKVKILLKTIMGKQTKKQIKKRKKKTLIFLIFSYLSYTHVFFECALKDNASQSFLKKKLLVSFNHGYQSITSLTRLSNLKTFLHFSKFSPVL